MVAAPSALRFRLHAFAVLLVALGFLSGCAIKLAPDYDKTIVDGLSRASEDAMTFFASVSGGVKAETFDRREDTYNKLIGKFDALKLQARARPTPRPLFLQVLGIGPSSDSRPEAIDPLRSPTPDILSTIVDGLSRMRDDDRASGLNRTVVSLFKRSFETSMDQALTYEKALER